MTNTGHDTSSGELPDGWQRTSLGDFSEIKYGYTESASDEPIGPRFLRITDIQDRQVNWDEVPYCQISEADFAKHQLMPGDLVFARTGATTGKSFAIKQPPEAVCASYLIRVRPATETAQIKFLEFFFQSDDYWLQIERGTTGTAQGGFNATKLGGLSVPVPPNAEQEWIVDALEAQLSHLDAALEHVQALREKAAQFRRSLLHAAFTGALTGHGRSTGELPVGWSVIGLGEVTDNHDGVRVPVKAADRSEMQGDYPYYGASGVIDYVNDYLFDGTYLLVSEDGANLIARTKPIAFEATGRFWVNNHAHVLTAKSGINQRYLMYLIDQSGLDGLVTGTAQPKITQRNLAKIPVPLAPLAEQERIVEVLEAQLSRLDAALAVADEVEERASALRRSLLHTAFTGKLTEKRREKLHA